MLPSFSAEFTDPQTNHRDISGVPNLNPYSGKLSALSTILSCSPFIIEISDVVLYYWPQHLQLLYHPPPMPFLQYLYELLWPT